MSMTIDTGVEPKRILIIGGGFGGVHTALHLAKQQIHNCKITLISDKHHFEYPPAFYKLATGCSPLEMCIPLSEIFHDDKKVEVIIDTIESGDISKKYVVGKSGSNYRYDFLVLALGSESAYFNIPGIAEHSFPLKSVEESLRIKRHLHTLFNSHANRSKGELMAQFQFVIVGGGPAGVELAGTIRPYTRMLAKMHGIPSNLVTVTIIQSSPRLLPSMNEEVSHLALERLDKLGINIILGKPVTKEDDCGVYLKDIEFNSKTIIWTAGVRANHVYGNIASLSLDKGGRVLVDEYMRAQGTENVFVIGDSASTPHAGTAQTAIYDGEYATKALSATLRNKKIPKYNPHQTPYVVPIGKNWAIFTYKDIVLSGWVFKWLRELIDLKFFMSILPFRKALNVWLDGYTICESCPTCEKTGH